MTKVTVEFDVVLPHRLAPVTPYDVPGEVVADNVEVTVTGTGEGAVMQVKIDPAGLISDATMGTGSLAS